MDGRTRTGGKTLLAAGVVLATLIGLVFFTGCAKEQPQQTATPEPVATGQAQVKAIVAEQTACPIMGGAINKEIFVEYQGQKVYFCCKGCPETFLANPEKYVAKLPQFQK